MLKADSVLLKVVSRDTAIDSCKNNLMGNIACW